MLADCQDPDTPGRAVFRGTQYTISMTTQNKASEISFFDGHAKNAGEYNVLAPWSNERIIDTLLKLTQLPSGKTILDLGCGSGVFTDILQRRGLVATGIDISPGMIAMALRNYPQSKFLVGDVENLPFPDASQDAVLLSGILHHFEDRRKFLSEVRRVLKPGGVFMAFDPNRWNPFMYLYRDRSSPLYSSKGVTENERPLIASHIRREFQAAGLAAHSDYLAHIHYRYIASPLARLFLTVYNWTDTLLFAPPFFRPFRPFVLTYGKKPS